MTRLYRSFGLLLATIVLARAQTIRLHSYPQKFREFYALSDPRVPAELKRDPISPPAGDARVLIVSGDGAVWMGGPQGLTRFDPKTDPNDRYQYFAGQRYLPDDDVQNLAPDGAAGVWVRTRTGVAHIVLRPMTLAEKAVIFEQRIRQRHDRHGFVASSHLREPGNLASNIAESTDNDGLWTAMYAAAECFRYSVTKSPEALANAKKATEAVLFLEQITGRPGYPARSYITPDEQKPRDGIWRWTADRKYQWKGDTSSDEIVGHFFLFGIAWDLLPDQELRARIVATARRIMDHILDHGYNLTDIDNVPTTWGKWSQSYFDTEGGKPDSPLNAIELLSFLKTTAHLTGDRKYISEYRKVALDLRYAELGTRQLELCHEFNYSDEELAMLSFYPLLRYEHDEPYRSFYRRAENAWWKNIQRERNPLWTFIHLIGEKGVAGDLEAASWTLYRIPIDLVEWTVTNSNRKDLAWDPQIDRFDRRQATTLLPPDERPVMKWNGNPFRVDGGNGGKGEDDGAFFLLPYWLGRYHGILVGQ